MQAVRVSDVLSILAQLAPPAFQESYDNSGLLIGDSSMKITGVLICLDVTQDVLEECRKNKCNLIVSHHPIIFKPIRSLTEATPGEKLIRRIIQSDIAVIAVHTNLDNSSLGINMALAGKLGLRQVKILEPKRGMLRKLVVFCPVDSAEVVREAIFSAGAGMIGNYDCCSFNSGGLGSFRANSKASPYVGNKGKLHFENEVRIETIFPSFIENRLIECIRKAHPYEEVAYDIYPLENAYPIAGSGVIGSLPEPLSPAKIKELIRKKLKVQHLRSSAYSREAVRSIAICSGSGAFLIPSAWKSGADAFLTADLKYHDFQMYDDQMLLIDAGHYETELIANEILKDALTKKFPNFAVLSSKSAKNPVNYT